LESGDKESQKGVCGYQREETVRRLEGEDEMKGRKEVKERKEIEGGGTRLGKEERKKKEVK
jgi:hypothetical protein